MSAAEPERHIEARHVRVASFDIAESGAPLASLSGLDEIRLLVRSGPAPLGWLRLSGRGANVDAEQVASTLLDQLAESLRREALRRRLSTAASEPALEPAISVVVCTRDRTDSLRRCLESLRDLSYPALEIVVVDNAPSGAETCALVAAMAPLFGPSRTLRYAREDRPGLDWARNRGIAESSHDLIAFTDDDVRVDPGWLSGIARAFADRDVLMVTGLVAPAELDTGAQLDFEDGYGGMGKGFHPIRRQRDGLTPAALLGAHHLGVGANMAFRRALLDRVGGFDTALDVGTPSHGAGDLEMFHRVLVSGAVAQYEPSALVWHSHRRDHAGLRRQLRDNGRAFGVYLIGCALRRTVPRGVVVRYAVRIWLGWLLGRLARSLVGRDALSPRLRAAELWGAMQAPWAYWRTRRSDRELRSAAPAE